MEDLTELIKHLIDDVLDVISEHSDTPEVEMTKTLDTIADYCEEQKSYYDLVDADTPTDDVDDEELPGQMTVSDYYAKQFEKATKVEFSSMQPVTETGKILKTVVDRQQNVPKQDDAEAKKAARAAWRAAHMSQ